MPGIQNAHAPLCSDVRKVVHGLFSSLVIVGLALLLCMPQAAWADGGVEVTEVYLRGNSLPDSVSPEPSSPWLASVQFSKNVSYANDGRDDAFVDANAQRVHLVGPGGKDVEGVRIVPGESRESRQIICIATDEWLSPLTTYHIVVDAGVVAANGVDVLDEEYSFAFTTSAQCSNGLSLYENVGIPLFALVLVAGAVVQVVRVRRNVR